MAHTIQYKNFEGKNASISIDDNEFPSAGTPITGSENPCVLSSLGDDDKTVSIKGKKMVIEFLSDEFTDVADFSNGYDGRFSVESSIEYVLSTSDIILRGSLLIDDNSEAFQPKPNVVTLTATDGLGILKEIELTDGGALPIGHYSIMQYIIMCLSDLPNQLDIHVAMNIFEEDSDDTASHTFADIFLDALTFEKDVDSREDKYTVLTKILDAFGCFISYENTGWCIVRWDEWDKLGGAVTELRFAKYDFNGTFLSYVMINVDKIIAHDQDALYEGYFLSQDNAIRRFQRKAKMVKHIYNFQQAKEVPCNSNFTRGDVIDDVLPLKTFELDCWEKTRVIRTTNVEDTTTSFDAFIQRRYDTLGNESERVLVLTPQTQNTTYWEGVNSQPFPVSDGDKFDFSLRWRLESDIAGGGTLQLVLFDIIVLGNDSSKWILGNTLPNGEGTWLWSDSSIVSSLVTWVAAFVPDDEDEEEFSTVSIDHDDIPPIPVEGDMVIRLHAINQNVSALDNGAVNYQDLTFTYVPFINGSYDTVNGQQVTVNSGGTVNKIIEHEMFISDSPKRLFKGALKKFDGTNYILTETWTDSINTTLSANAFAWFIVFQWWNQFRKTRTVIETDVQGIKSDTEGGRPGLIHRYKIIHGDQEDKYFMMTRLGMLNIMTCGWQGVFVETSDSEGDRNYDDTFEFKFIQ
jgi:hypothetical protein